MLRKDACGLWTLQKSRKWKKKSVNGVKKILWLFLTVWHIQVCDFFFSVVPHYSLNSMASANSSYQSFAYFFVFVCQIVLHQVHACKNMEIHTFTPLPYLHPHIFTFVETFTPYISTICNLLYSCHRVHFLQYKPCLAVVWKCHSLVLKRKSIKEENLFPVSGYCYCVIY